MGLQPGEGIQEKFTMGSHPEPWEAMHTQEGRDGHPEESLKRLLRAFSKTSKILFFVKPDKSSHWGSKGAVPILESLLRHS